MPDVVNNAQLVVSGFHRSGTSLTMQALVKAGLRAGDRLMPAHPSNPDGHYEDLDVVALHQSVLQDHGRDWFSPGGAIKPASNPYDGQVKGIIDRLDEAGSSWGFKDPRTCLFLDWWFERLTRPAGVFVYRHYRACNRSLRTREAQELVFSAQPESVELRFWKDPHQGLRLWADYNRCLLSFAEQHREEVVVVSYDALMAGFNLVESVNRTFKLTLNEKANTGIRTGAAGLIAADYDLPDIPAELYEELESILAGLDALSQGDATVRTSSGQQQSPANTCRADEPRVRQSLIDAGLACTVIDPQVAPAPASAVDEPPEACDLLSDDWDAEETTRAMEASVAARDDVRALQIATLYEHEHQHHLKLQLILGQLHLRRGNYECADRHLQRACNIDPDHRTGLVLRGMLAERQQQFKIALQLFDRVLGQTPDDAGTYLHKARCLQGLGLSNEALAACDRGLILKPDLHGLQLCKLDLMIAGAPVSATRRYFHEVLEEHAGNAALWMRYSQWLAHLGESAAAQAAYYRAIRLKVWASEAYDSNLIRSIDSVAAGSQRQHLQYHVCKELDRLSKTTTEAPGVR